jgi:hypothetical protein
VIIGKGNVEGQKAKTMIYVKPELVVLAPAVAAIQSGYKSLGFLWDSYLIITIGAYEADE